MTAQQRKGLERCGFLLSLTLTFSLASALAAGKTASKPMQITSTAFTEGSPIPAQHTCEGKNTSPSLKWRDVPPGTKSLVLITDDPDAPVGTWVHWVLYDIPPGTTELGEGIAKDPCVLKTAKQGINDFRQIGYGGPCPPPGKPHRYFFKLYALDRVVDLKPGATKRAVEGAMAGHILGQAQLVGTYQRSR